jgi:DNA-binding NtrC family response regulator
MSDAKPADRARVLVVDDEEMVRASIVALLSRDYDLRAVGSADAARRALAELEADVVITDFEMPGESGLELLRALKREHPSIIGMLLTGHADLLQVQTAKKSREIFYLLVKPYAPESLLQWTSAAASAARLRRSVKGLNQTVKDPPARAETAKR